MLQRAEARDFEVITFWKLDRFCRSLVDLVNLERVLRGWGVELCSATEFIDTTSSIGRFNYRTLASVAELEREQIGERARLGLYGRARERKWPNAHPPLGYVIAENGRLLVEPASAELVNRVFRMYLESESTPEVAFRLNEGGFRTRKGKWNARAVRDILTNPIYVGTYKVAGFEEDSEEYRIVPNGTFEKTSEILARFEGEDASRPSMPRDRKVAGINMVHERFGEFLNSLPSEILR